MKIYNMRITEQTQSIWIIIWNGRSIWVFERWRNIIPATVQDNTIFLLETPPIILEKPGTPNSQKRYQNTTLKGIIAKIAHRKCSECIWKSFEKD